MTRIMIRVFARKDKPYRLHSRQGSEADVLVCLTLEDGYGRSPVVELACRQEDLDIRMAVEADGFAALPDRQRFLDRSALEVEDRLRQKRLLPGRRQGRQAEEDAWFRRIFTKEER